MHLQRIENRLTDLRNELERMDSTGQPTSVIVNQIARLQKFRDEVADGIAISPQGSFRRFSESVVDKLLE